VPDGWRTVADVTASLLAGAGFAALTVCEQGARQTRFAE
jgi:hypothetical protein